MRVPSDAQAALLALIAEHEEAGRDVEWMVATTETLDRPSRARLYIEVIDREKNTSSFTMADGWTYAHRVATVRACLRLGWLDDLHQRTVRFPKHRYQRRDHARELHQLDLTEDGVIALGLWRERKLNAPPAPLPTLSAREREIVELAQRAHELGYALCAREPARLEARRMRRAGWFGACWVANSATGLVPSPMAVVEVRPALADEAVAERNGAPAS
jgi:hypothetical protein